MINIYIESNFKGLKGKVDYGYVMEWERPGKDIATKEFFGTLEDTRNRVFLKLAIEAMDRIRIPEELHIYINCDYVAANAARKAPEDWLLNNWMKGNGEEVKNSDLWSELLKRAEILKPSWYKGQHKYSEWIIRGIEKQYERNCVPL